MAVYTKLSQESIEQFLSHYDCGKLELFEGIAQGVENTNYKIKTDKTRCILTVFEKRTDPEALPFIFNFMGFLKMMGIYCPGLYIPHDGNAISEILEKPAVLVEMLDGRPIEASDITSELCSEMGKMLGHMHQFSEFFPETRSNSMSLSAWKSIFEKINGKVDDAEFIAGEISRAEKTLGLDLPKGAVHADVFPDNVFIREGHVESIIDFYFSCTDYFIYDLAITINAWCFENGNFNKEKFDKFIEGYQVARPLSSEEKMHFSDMARAAALRILMTRTHDFVFHDPANLVTPKDPSEYKRILEFHAGQNLFS